MEMLDRKDHRVKGHKVSVARCNAGDVIRWGILVVTVIKGRVDKTETGVETRVGPNSV